MCLDVDEDGKVDMDMTYTDGGAKWWLNETAAGSSMLQLIDVGDVDTRDGNQSRSEALVDLDRDGKLDWVRGAQGQNFKVDFGDGKGNFTAGQRAHPAAAGRRRGRGDDVRGSRRRRRRGHDRQLGRLLVAAAATTTAACVS